MNIRHFVIENHHQRPVYFLFALMLAGSLATEIKLPFIGVGLQNLLIPVTSIGILFSCRQSWQLLWSRHRRLVLALAAFSLWAFVASIRGPFPATSLYYWLKYNLLGLALPASFCLLADRERRWPSLGLVHGFLVLLAVFGIVEVIFPDSLLFLLFRSDDSLTIYPRVASLMAWPNQFGVLMAIGAVISEQLGRRGLLTKRITMAATLLFLTQVAQSGSRNAWMVLIVSLLWMAARRSIPAARAAVVLVVFLGIVLLLPVSARQAWLWDQSPNHPLISKDIQQSTSLSSPVESLSLRMKLWREAAHEIRQHPVSGLGLEIFQLEIGPRVMDRPGFNAHNLPLNLAVELGLVGLALAMTVGWQLLRNRQTGTVTEVALLAFLVGQVLDCFLHDAVFMTLFFFFAADFVSPLSEDLARIGERELHP